MNVNRVLIFKSIEATKQNSSNKPGDFTTKFTPEMKLDPNKQHFLLRWIISQCQQVGIMCDLNMKTIN